MPEGDTIHKVAAFMAPRLQGHLLQDVRVARLSQPDMGRRTVVRVEARGKNLLVALSPDAPQGWLVRVHLGMHGSWHSYAPGARWQRPAHTASVELVREDGHVFVCFGAEDVECLRQGERPDGSVLQRLGPDLLAAQLDLPAILQRARQHAQAMPAADVLLRQSIAAGLGNVYKSELLFMHRIHPLRPMQALSDDALSALFVDGRRLLQQNLGGWARTTTFDRSAGPGAATQPRYFVYGRAGLPCPSCHTPIVRALLGRHRRSTYFCPACQPAT